MLYDANAVGLKIIAPPKTLTTEVSDANADRLEIAAPSEALAEYKIKKK